MSSVTAMPASPSTASFRKTIDQFTTIELARLRNDKHTISVILNYPKIVEDEGGEAKMTTAPWVITMGYSASVARVFSDLLASRFEEPSVAPQGQGLMKAPPVASIGLSGEKAEYHQYKAVFQWFEDYCEGKDHVPRLDKDPLSSVLIVSKIARKLRANAVVPVLAAHLKRALSANSKVIDPAIASKILDFKIDAFHQVLADYLAEAVATKRLQADAAQIAALGHRSVAFAAKLEVAIPMKVAEQAEKDEEARMLKENKMTGKKVNARSKKRDGGPKRGATPGNTHHPRNRVRGRCARRELL